MNPPRRMIVMIIVSCFCLVPFLPFKGWFEGIAEDSSIFAEGLCFLYTSAILFMSDRCVKGKKTQGDIAYKDAITDFFRELHCCPAFQDQARLSQQDFSQA
jgi:undecaprenyl-diphosphatase